MSYNRATKHASIVEHNSGPPLKNSSVQLREYGFTTDNVQKDRSVLADIKNEVTVIESHV